MRKATMASRAVSAFKKRTFIARERQRRLCALIESEQEFRAAFEISSIGCSQADAATGRLLRVNRRFCEMTGYSESELLGRPFWELALPDDRTPNCEGFVRLCRGEDLEYRAEKRYRRKDGEIITVDVTTNLVRDPSGRPLRTVSMLVDVTARRLAERALEDAQARLVAELEAMKRLHAISTRFVHEGDVSSILEEIVEAAMAITGAEKGIIRLVDDAGALRIAAQRGFEAPYLEQCRPIDVDLVGERLASLNDGAHVLVEDICESPLFVGTRSRDALIAAGVRSVLMTQLYSRSGKIVGLLSTYYRTPRRPEPRHWQLLDLLARQSADIIERAGWIEERAQFIARARLVEELREADRRKNEFIAVLSHELRNPLTPIKNSLFLLQNTDRCGQEAELATAIIDRQVSQLARLVDDLLDVTRITQNKIQLRRAKIDLNELVQKTAEDNRSIFERSGIRLDVIPSGSPVIVDGDATRLAQVVGNLLQNAAKFTPQGGKTAVLIEDDADAGKAVIRVVDTGVGIEPGMSTRLFEPFMQADTTLDRNKGGLGLGLALVKGLTELHGGEVSAHSEGLNKGAEFVVRLPLDIAATAGSRAASVKGGRSGLRVLLIDDNRDLLESLGAVLRLFKNEVDVAWNGPAGIERARSRAPDVVFCDIGLPEMSGYDVARAFRADESLRSTFLVALSGYALAEDVSRARESGFDMHLAKPPDVETIKQVLAAASARA